MIGMHQLMHVTGVLCLIAMAVAGGWSLWSTAWLNRHRIAAALRGLPVPPAASVAPHATAPSTPLRSVEAAAEPTFQVRA